MFLFIMLHNIRVKREPSVGDRERGNSIGGLRSLSSLIQSSSAIPCRDEIRAAASSRRAGRKAVGHYRRGWAQEKMKIGKRSGAEMKIYPSKNKVPHPQHTRTSQYMHTI